MMSEAMQPWEMHSPFGVEVEEGASAKAGSPLEPGAEYASMELIIEALQTVFDPEIPVNIYDLGLIYDITPAENGDVAVRMTLTTPACPVAGQMPSQVAQAVAGVAGVGEVTVTLTWDPPWTPDQMSADAKLVLGWG